MIEVRPEIEHAIKNNLPVIGLESAILSFGLPYPENFNLTMEALELIRSQNCYGAVIAIINGKITVGLTQEEIEKFSKKELSIVKISSRDISGAILKKQNGATTVSASMAICFEAGIKVFCTGGIGGVHVNAFKSFDVSEDCVALHSYPVICVCAGPKSVLDVEATYELLETLSIPILKYRTDTLPAFYSTNTGLSAGIKVDSAIEISKFANIYWGFKKYTGILVVNPVDEKFSIDYEITRTQRIELTELAQKLGITGKNVTPFILEKIHNLSKGTTVKLNSMLFLNNIKCSIEIAKLLCKNVNA